MLAYTTVSTRVNTDSLAPSPPSPMAPTAATSPHGLISAGALTASCTSMAPTRTDADPPVPSPSLVRGQPTATSASGAASSSGFVTHPRASERLPPAYPSRPQQCPGARQRNGSGTPAADCNGCSSRRVSYPAGPQLPWPPALAPPPPDPCRLPCERQWHLGTARR